MEKYGIAEQATDDYAMLRMRCVWWVTNAADTHKHNIAYLLLSHGNSRHANRPNVVSVHILSCLSIISYEVSQRTLKYR